MAAASGPSGSARIQLFSTCPQSRDVDSHAYRARVTDVARWSEQAGYQGILVYSDNGLVDPWLVSQLILQATTTLSPLIAIQPIYQHPYTAARMVATFAFLHQRRIWLNMLAGGFKNDLIALHDATPHDERYARTTEYAHIMRQLMARPDPVTFHGTYYQVTNLKLHPSLPEELFPGILMSGSSPAGLAAAKAVGATAVKYPEPLDQMTAEPQDGAGAGVRVGVIARPTAESAWEVAHRRFPEDRKGQIAHALAMKVSDSHWHRQLSQLDGAQDGPYWLGPFKNYKTFCPYLVGSYQRVGAELAGYIDLGFTTFILDIPPTREELDHTGAAFQEAARLVRR